MTNQTRASHPIYNLYPRKSRGSSSLAELALDMRWSWNHATDEVWRQLDPELWEITHNPWAVLQTVSRDRIERVLADPAFRKNVDGLVTNQAASGGGACMVSTESFAGLPDLRRVFQHGIHVERSFAHLLGGLGNVAGDQLKAASDLGVPVIGVGLLYQQGYFRQVIDKDGAQQALSRITTPDSCRSRLCAKRTASGCGWRSPYLVISVWLRAWQVQVGRVKLYLLDSNDAANLPAHRGIYQRAVWWRPGVAPQAGAAPRDRRMRRSLGALGIQPEVCHLNEGHAAFAVLERARSFMQGTAQPFEVALAVTRAGNLFTTHTAVAAGFDCFAPALIEQYLGGYAKQKLGITLDDLLALGRQNPNDSSEPFNMAYLAVRGSGAVNGVSRLHGKVSQRIFMPLFPHWPQDEIPVGHVTNGVHMPTWDSAPADDLWTEACGKGRWLGTTKAWSRTFAASPTPGCGNFVRPPASLLSTTLGTIVSATDLLRRVAGGD